jgi:hypothetical protein
VLFFGAQNRRSKRRLGRYLQNILFEDRSEDETRANDGGGGKDAAVPRELFLL